MALYSSCPDCGGRLIPQEGCAFCPSCGYSACGGSVNTAPEEKNSGKEVSNNVSRFEPIVRKAEKTETGRSQS